MKNCLFLPVVILLTSCQQEPELTVAEKVTEQLAAAESWKAPTVTVDGVDYSDLYKDFSVKFEATTYSSTGGAPVWPASGTWKFINEEATRMLLDNTLEVQIDAVTDESLELSLQWNKTTFEPGRASSVKGQMKFKLKRN
jgi:hypothetical protein